jgi:AcrR family transcriptional regulator
LDLKQRIVDRALELFNEHGIERVGMRELARDLELAPGNLTYHFARKEDVVAAIAARFGADNSAILEPRTRSLSFAQFFELLRPVFNNQYRYRCLTLNLVNLLDDYPALATRYRANQKLRRDQLQRQLQQLQAAACLRADLTQRERDWLVSYCQLIGRFWMIEYHVLHREQPIAQVIASALRLLADAFAPYATTAGREELAPYLEPLAPMAAEGVDT